MKILSKAKLLVLLPLITLAFGCESKEAEIVKEENPPIEKKVNVPSPLREQIQIMLAGKPHDEVILKAEVGKQEWKVTFAMLKEELAKYSVEKGKKPEKKLISRTYARLTKIRSDHDLAISIERKNEALKDLEGTIQKAIEVEKSKQK